MWVGLGDSTVFSRVGCHKFPPPFTEEAYIHLSDVLDSKPPTPFFAFANCSLPEEDSSLLIQLISYGFRKQVHRHMI
jgi:hypothetical protein